MTRLRLVLGTRFLHQGAIYVMRAPLFEEIRAAWAQVEARFEMRPPEISGASERARSAVCHSVDLGGLLEEVRDEAWRWRGSSQVL